MVGKELLYAGVQNEMEGGATAPVQHAAQVLQDECLWCVSVTFSVDAVEYIDAPFTLSSI